MPAFNVCTYSLWARYCQYLQRAYIITIQRTSVQQVLECNRGRAVQLVESCSRSLIEAEQSNWQSRACCTALPLLNLSSTFSTKTIRCDQITWHIELNVTGGATRRPCLCHEGSALRSLTLWESPPSLLSPAYINCYCFCRSLHLLLMRCGLQLPPLRLWCCM